MGNDLMYVWNRNYAVNEEYFFKLWDNYLDDDVKEALIKAMDKFIEDKNKNCKVIWEVE